MVRQHQTRNLEIPGSMLTHRPGMRVCAFGLYGYTLNIVSPRISSTRKITTKM
jgi:hypothetical protein